MKLQLPVQFLPNNYSIILYQKEIESYELDACNGLKNWDFKETEFTVTARV